MPLKPNEPKTAHDPKLDPDADPAAPVDLTPMLKDMMGAIKQMGDVQAKTSQQLVTLQTQFKEQNSAPIVAPTPAPENIDLESLSREDFMREIVKNVTESVKTDLIAPVASQVTGLGQFAATNVLTTQMAQLKTQFPDSGDWGGEISAMLQANPRLPVEDAYLIAKGRNPTKAGELTEKYAKLAETRKDEQTAELVEQFGGMFPNAAPIKIERDDMTLDDAGQDAWDKTIERHPELANN